MAKKRCPVGKRREGKKCVARKFEVSGYIPGGGGYFKTIIEAKNAHDAAEKIKFHEGFGRWHKDGTWIQPNLLGSYEVK